MDHKQYLKISAVVVGSFGPLFTTATLGGAYATPIEFTLDLLSGTVGRHSLAADSTRFVGALTGGFLFGWGVTIWNLAGEAYDAAPEAVRKTVVRGLCSWFVLDSIGSVLSKNPVNVLWNVVVLAIAVGPLWWPAPDKKNK